MAFDKFPHFIRENYELYEWKHATAILENDFQKEWNDLIDLLTVFRIYKSWISIGGGGKSKLAAFIDEFLAQRGWVEKGFKTLVTVDGYEMETPTHKIDCYKNRVALEVEWNNKDPFFDRDLNNFRLLFDLRAISVGIILTRSDELQELFESLNRGASFGQSTTHMSKLLPRIDGGGGGGCPILAIGMRKSLYVED